MSETETEAPKHDLLDALENGDTVRLELENGDVITGEIEETRYRNEGDIIGQGTTLADKDSPGKHDVYDIEAAYDPRDGWSPVTLKKRFYVGNDLNWGDDKTVEALVPINPGIDREKLEPGVTVEHLDGDHYRVVVPPWEREYDNKALAYNLDSVSNACEKVDPDEVVRRVE